MHITHGEQHVMDAANPVKMESTTVAQSDHTPPPSVEEKRVLNLKALYVTGLAPNADFIDLHKHFDRFGDIVLCRVLKDAKTGISRGIGYVNFDSEEEAAAAQKATDGFPGPRDEPALSVKFAEADPTYRAVATTKVFVRYVPPHITVSDVRTAFAKYGKVLDVTIEPDRSRVVKRGPHSWNYAYVVYPTTKEANFAIAHATKDINWGPQPIVTKPAETEEARVARGTASKKPAQSPSSATHAARPAMMPPNRYPQPGLPFPGAVHHHHHQHQHFAASHMLGMPGQPFMTPPMVPPSWPQSMNPAQPMMVPMFQPQPMMMSMPQHAHHQLMPTGAFPPPQPFVDPATGMMMMPMDPHAGHAWAPAPGGYMVLPAPTSPQ